MYAVNVVSTSRLHRATIACALVCALVVPAVSSAQDRGSAPTSSLAGTTSAPAAVSTSSLAGTTSAPSQDLRSADNRDPLMRQGTLGAPDVTVVKLPQPAPVHGNPAIDPRGLGIGAAITLALVALWFAGAAAVAQHRRGGPRPATAV
jgi:hypothetical protein